MVQKQLNQALVNYIWTYLHQGYSLTSIRSQLKQNNYSDADINAAVDYVYANYYYGKQSNDPRKSYPEQKPSHQGHSFTSLHTMLPLLLVILGVFVFGFAVIILLVTGPSETIVSPTTPSPVIPSSPSSPITPPSELEPPLDDTLPETNDSAPSLETPSAPRPQAPSLTDSTPEFFPGESPSEIAQPFEEGVQYTPRQISLKVQHFGPTNPREAIKFCNLLVSPVERDFCYRDVAELSKNSLYCREVIDPDLKDDCYFNLVLDGSLQDDLCESIVNTFKKESCRSVLSFSRNLQTLDSPDLNGPDFDNLDLFEFASLAEFS